MKSISIHEHIVENLLEGLIGIDRSMAITIYNQSAERITGIPRTFAIGMRFERVMHLNGWMVDIVKKTLDEGKVFADYKCRLRQRLETIIPVILTASPILDREGFTAGVILSLRELSGRRFLEEDTIRRNRLAIIGTFATGITHEIKNPLSGIKGAAQLLSRKIEDPGLAEYTNVIVNEVGRLENIVNEILHFSNPKGLKAHALNIHEILDSAIKVIPFRNNLSMHKEYDPSLPLILGDREQLIKVFLNLIKNAVEAINEDGRIRILTRMVTDFHLIKKDFKEETKMVSIEIIDNGCGMPADDLERIFTPFFSTKPEGTGLGVPISFRIIKEHKGFLLIDSSQGEGTRITVYLPVMKEKGDER